MILQIASWRSIGEPELQKNKNRWETEKFSGQVLEFHCPGSLLPA
jgi:hypothetical protein